MTATIIPFAELKMRMVERDRESMNNFVRAVDGAALNLESNHFLLGMQQLMQSNVDRARELRNFALLESIYKTDCGEWPKWEDYL
jgi:hypothetical protein